MKATGIVRRIDDLGRVIIPKELRRNLGIREGDPLEIFIDDGNVIFKKYTYVSDFDYKKAFNIIRPILKDVKAALYDNYLDCKCYNDKAEFASEMSIDYDYLPDTCYEINIMGDKIAYLYLKGNFSVELKDTLITILKAFFTDY